MAGFHICQSLSIASPRGACGSSLTSAAHSVSIWERPEAEETNDYLNLFQMSEQEFGVNAHSKCFQVDMRWVYCGGEFSFSL